MRLATPLVTVVGMVGLALLIGASAADDRSPTANENWRPPGYTGGPSPVVATPQLVNDGSFENGPPPASAWAESSSTVACEWIGDHTAIFGVGSHDGSNDYWSGGYCAFVPTASSVTQTISIPAGTTKLSFWIYADRVDPDDDALDMAFVSINGTEIWSRPMTVANNTAQSWINQMVNIPGFAGQTVQLKLGNRSGGLATGNTRFDFLELIGEPVSARPGTWGRLKTLYR